MVMALAEAMARAERPTAAKAACTSSPQTVPSATRAPSRREPAITFRLTSTKLVPGINTNGVTAATKPIT
ncbi:hypothetical protein GCM10010493_75040 [Streptomyces lavendulae subsp. grasserius]